MGFIGWSDPLDHVYGQVEGEDLGISGMGYKGWLGFGLSMDRKERKKRMMQTIVRLLLVERTSPPSVKSMRPFDIL